MASAAEQNDARVKAEALQRWPCPQGSTRGARRIEQQHARSIGAKHPKGSRERGAPAGDALPGEDGLASQTQCSVRNDDD
jgi:hypothetical protein